MKANVFYLIASMLLITAGGFAAKDKKVEGNGKVVTKQIPISGYERISVAGNIHFEYEQSSAPAAFQIRTDENILECLDIEVKGKTLIIGPKKDVQNYSIRPTVCTIKSNSSTLKELNVAGGTFAALSPLNVDKLELNLAGSGGASFGQLKARKARLNVAGSKTLKIDDLRVNELHGNVAGGGTILAVGVADDANLNVAGGGSIEAYGCKVCDAQCNVAGGGSIKVHVSEELNANITGGGSIRYEGDPKVEKSVLGGGSIKKNE